VYYTLVADFGTSIAAFDGDLLHPSGGYPFHHHQITAINHHSSP
jgi:hypothetical protein